MLEKWTTLKTFLKVAAQVAKAVAFVARQFKDNVESTSYQALLVGVDREASALYKHALDQLLPPETSAVV